PAWEAATAYDADDAVLLDRRPASPRERRRAPHSQEYASYPSHAYPAPDNAREQPTRRRKLRPRSPRPTHSRSYDADCEFDHPWSFDPEEEDAPMDEPEPERAPSDEGAYIPSRHQTEWTPTCGEQFRRHWQALSLSLRFSLFRAQRRIKRRVGI
ncbi:hypothetical protein OF83DRAFT_1178052, partial [Amylostereum chailletii]